MSAFVGDYCSESSQTLDILIFHTGLFLSRVRHAYIHTLHYIEHRKDQAGTMR